MQIDTSSPIFHVAQAVGRVLPDVMLWIGVGGAVGLVAAVLVAGSLDLLHRQPRRHRGARSAR